eukprot:gene2633-830_t
MFSAAKSQKKKTDQLEGPCRVKNCRSYGKIFLDLYRHLKLYHPLLTVVDHRKLPVPSDNDLLSANHRPYMKYRKREFCKVTGCPKQWEAFNDLTRHLRKKHKISREEYHNLYPKIELELKVTSLYEDGTSIILPEELDFFKKIDSDDFTDFPDIPAECPIRDEKRGSTPIRDESKVIFINPGSLEPGKHAEEALGKCLPSKLYRNE